MTRGGARVRGCAGLLLVAAVGGCRPNPRNEIGAIADAALAELARTAPGERLCVQRTILPWRRPGEVRRHDPPAPPGFEPLYGAGVFRGGGGLKAAAAGGVAVGASPGCFDLRGPLVAGDQAMIEVHPPGTGWNVWLHRDAGDWRVVMTTTSVYAGKTR